MQILLTGAPGAGKSTVLRRTLALLGAAPGGFYTGFAPDGRRLCLWPAEGPPCWDRAHTVALREGGTCRALPGAFDRVGPPILAGNRTGLVVMDELGNVERDEAEFQRAVLACLDSPALVLGVVKPRRAGTWLEALAARPDAAVVEVTQAGRDGLPEVLAGMIRKEGAWRDESRYTTGKGL